MQKDNTYIIDLPKIADPRGNLTVAEQMTTGPTTFPPADGAEAMPTARARR